MDDLARLGVVITPQGITTTASQLNNLTKEGRAAAAQLAQFQAGAGRTQQAVSGMNAGLGQMRTILAAIVATGAVKQAIDLADTYTLIAARLRLVTTSAANARDVQEQLFNAAQATRGSFESMAALFTRVARNADQLGASQQQVIRFTTGLSQAIQVSGASSTEAAAGLQQLSQALASGEVRGDEFRSIMENLPFVADQVAKALGRTTGELRQMSQAGELTSKVFFDAMLQRLPEIQRQFAQMPVTVGGATQKVENSFGRLLDSMNRTYGWTQSLASGIDQIAQALASESFSDEVSKFFNVIANDLERLSSYSDEVSSLFSVIAGAASTIGTAWLNLPAEIKSVGLIAAIFFGPLGRLAAGLTLVPEIFARFIDGLVAMDKATEDLFGAWDSFDWDSFSRGFREGGQALEKLNSLYGNFNIELGETQAELDKLAGKRREQADAERLVGLIIGELNVKQAQATRLTNEQNTAFANLAKRIDPAGAALAQYNEDVELLGKVFRSKDGPIKSQEEYNRLLELAKKRYDSTVESLDKKKDAHLRVVRAMEDEIAVMRAEIDLGATAASRLRQEQQLRDQLGLSIDEVRDSYGSLLDEYSRTEEILDRQRQAARDWETIWTNAAKNIADAIADMLLTLGKGDLGGNLLGLARNIGSQLITSQVFGPWISQVGQATRPGGSLANGFSLAGAGASLLGGAFTQGSQFMANLGGQIAGPSGAIAGYNMSSPAGLLGGMAGSILSSLLFKPRKGPGNEIGGAVGGILGSAIPIPFVGTAIGSFLGSTLGGLFGARPSDQTEGFDMTDIARGRVNPVFLAGKRSEQNRGISDAFQSNVEGIFNLISAVGGKSSITNMGFTAGSRDGYTVRLGTAEGSTFNNFQDLQAAWAFFIQQAKGSITGLGPVVAKAFDVVDLDSDEGSNLIMFAKTVQDLLASPATDAARPSELAVAFKSLDDQLAGMRPNLAAIGQEVTVLDGVFAKLKEQLITDFMGGLEETLNALRGNSFLNDMTTLVTEITGLRANALTARRGGSQVEEIFGLSIKRITDSITKNAASTDEARAKLQLLSQTFSNIPEVVDAVVAALAGLTTPVVPVVPGTGPVVTPTQVQTAINGLTLIKDTQLEIIDLQVKAVEAALGPLRTRLTNFLQVGAASDDALFKIGASAEFGSTVGERYSFVRAQFQQTLAGARAGDDLAAGRLPDLALEFLKISREFNATSDAFFADRDQVEQALRDNKSLAATQVDLLRNLVSVQEQALAALQAQRTAVQSGTVGADGLPVRTSYTAADQQALGTAYSTAFANSGMSLNDWVNSSQFGIWERARDQLIGGLDDRALLLQNLAQAKTQVQHDVLGGAGSRWEAAVRARLHQIGVPGFALGGPTGLAFAAHKDETIVMGNRAQVVSAETARQAVAEGSRQSGELNNTMKMTARQQIEMLFEVKNAVVALTKEMMAQRRVFQLVLES